MSVKCHHHHSSSTSSGSGIAFLPQKKHVFSSPNCDQLKEALQSRGACEFDVKRVFQQKIMQIDFYPIPTCNLNELIHMKMAFDIKAADLLSGNIQLNISANSIIGIGAFKTAHSARLTLFPLTHSGIGSEPNCEIVLKRPYIDDHPAEPGPLFTCYSLKDESNMLYCEANVLYWAKVLLKMTYKFIDHAIDSAKESPPFRIPCLHFVDAGLLLAYSYVPVATVGGTAQSVKSSSMVILLDHNIFIVYY
ncbi:hypothetical protein J3A83DRAFT_4374152 [Scleroderma citrinum]